MRGQTRRFSAPLWRGESLAGKTLLLHSEQGHGDTIQFLKLAPRLAALGARVVVITVPTLAELVKSCPGVVAITMPESAPPHDFHAPLMSLPLLLGLRVETIPNEPTHLTANAIAVETWRERWRDLPRPLVGIAWQGNPKHVGDRWRSVKLTQFAPIAARIAELGGTLVSLQVGPGVEQLDGVPFPVTDFRTGLPPDATFADTAAAICASTGS